MITKRTAGRSSASTHYHEVKVESRIESRRQCRRIVNLPKFATSIHGCLAFIRISYRHMAKIYVLPISIAGGLCFFWILPGICQEWGILFTEFCRKNIVYLYIRFCKYQWNQILLCYYPRNMFVNVWQCYE